MKSIGIGLGVVAMVVAGWFLLAQSDTVSYVAAMNDDVTALEQDLMEIEAEVAAGTLTPDEAAEAQVRIISRLDAINTATQNNERAELTPAQRAQLLEALERLKQILIAYSATLVTLDDTVMEMPAAERPASVRVRGGSRTVALDTVVVVEAHVDEVVPEYLTDTEIRAEAEAEADAAEMATTTEDGIEMVDVVDSVATSTDEMSGDTTEAEEASSAEAADTEAVDTDAGDTPDENDAVQSEAELGVEVN